MWSCLEGNSVNQLWSNVVEACRGDGASVFEGRDGETREILHAALCLENPRARWNTVRRPTINLAFALAEVVWILAGRNDMESLSFFNGSLKNFVGDSVYLHGAYGHRLRKSFGFDQLDAAYRALGANPTTRQIVLQYWDPNLDFPDTNGEPRNRDIPCNTQSMLKVRQGRLEWVQVMRSNDVFIGLPYNIVQFTFLQEILAGWLEMDVGPYHHLSDSLHVYTRDLDKMRSAECSDEFDLPVFSLGKEKSDRAFETLSRYLDVFIDSENRVGDLLSIDDSETLPGAYSDVLTVLQAEAIRRRGDSDVANRVMANCRTEVFSAMWRRWASRVG